MESGCGCQRKVGIDCNTAIFSVLEFIVQHYIPVWRFILNFLVDVRRHFRSPYRSYRHSISIQLTLSYEIGRENIAKTQL